MNLTQAQADFVKFLADIWQCDGCLIDPERSAPLEPCSTSLGALGFLHQYPITKNRVWDDWKKGRAGHPGALGTQYDLLRQNLWWCSSLHQAFKHYSWSNGSQSRFDQLSSDIKQAINQGKTQRVRDLCLEIFKWGNVAKKSDDPSRKWVEEEPNGTLIRSLCAASQLLAPTSVGSLSQFNGTQLLMNSAMTKVYAAVDTSQTVAMYDGRVGAALGLLVRLFLQRLQITEVPQDLAFLWGPMQGNGKANLRNPSSHPYRFTSLYAANVTDQIRAENSRMANYVLDGLVKTLVAMGHSVTVREIEMAMFMIGYRVR